MTEIVEALGHWALGMLSLLGVGLFIIFLIWLFNTFGEFLFACFFGCLLICAVTLNPMWPGEQMIGWWQG